MIKVEIREVDNDYRCYCGSEMMEFKDIQEAQNWCKENSWSGCRYSVGHVYSSRDKFNNNDKSFVSGAELVYVGHTPIKETKVLGNVIYIDQGAVFGGKLTILEMY